MAEEAKQETKQQDTSKKSELKFIDTKSIVIDNGQHKIKAGHGGDDLPRVCMPNMVGRSKEKSDTIIYGHHINMAQDPLDISKPMKYQLIQNWEDIELIWDYTLTKRLKVDPSEQNILLTEPCLHPPESREKCIKIFFEKFNVPKFYLALTGVLALYASGRKTGVVLDCGHGVTHTVPVIDGYAVPAGIRRIDMGGDQMEQYLATLLKDKYENAEHAKNASVIQRIKHRFGEVALDYEVELKSCVEQSYTLPDGKVIKIGSEGMQCGEALFKPELAGKDKQYTLPNSLNESVMKCDEDKRDILYKNIVLAGGTTYMTGFCKRLKKEVSILAKKDQTLNFIAPTERAYSNWIGGSILVSLSTFQDMYVTKKEYEESGAKIIHKKCK